MVTQKLDDQGTLFLKMSGRWYWWVQSWTFVVVGKTILPAAVVPVIITETLSSSYADWAVPRKVTADGEPADTVPVLDVANSSQGTSGEIVAVQAMTFGLMVSIGTVISVLKALTPSSGR